MKIFARYDDEDRVLCGAYVCELSEEEMLSITTDKLDGGAVVEVPNLVELRRAAEANIEKTQKVLRYAKRLEDLLQMLTREIEQARLDVSLKEIPDLRVARALTNTLHELL